MINSTKERLKQAREGKGWSRAQLARAAGMHPSTVGQIESGRIEPYPSQLEKLARALGLNGGEDVER